MNHRRKSIHRQSPFIVSPQPAPRDHWGFVRFLVALMIFAALFGAWLSSR